VIDPDAGPAGTAVQLGADFWQPSSPVQIFVASASKNDTEPAGFAGPVATTTSDANGRWSVRLKVEDATGFIVPAIPAFVVYKALSPTPGSVASAGPTEAIGSFALVVDGHRPDGAGGVRLTIEGPTSTAWLDWQPAGSDTFYITHVGPFGPPLRGYLTNHLTNGDWDIVVPSTLTPVTATGGRVLSVQATLCASPSIPCDPRPGSFTVVRVPVRNGEVADVMIEMGTPAAFPPAGQGPTRSAARGLALLAMAMLVSGVALVRRARMIH
jgi:hypothetical protein